MDGIELISAERERQIEALGYTVEHDLTHDHSDLVFAAVCYAAPVTVYLLRNNEEHPHPGGGRHGSVEWAEPWPREWDRKPREYPTPVEDRIRELTKAGALIAAEIDRLMALEGPQ